MRIAIIGTGAMGSLFAAHLAPYARLVMVGSWSAQLSAARDPGLLLHHLDGRESRHIIGATTRGAKAGPADFVLILVKGWQTESAAELARSALAHDGLVLTLQNGLGNLEVISKVVGDGRVAQGVTSEGATMLAAGAVRHAGRGQTHIAATEATRPRLEKLASLFNQAGLSTSVVDDALSLIWGKLAVNAGINPLTALLQVTNGYLLQDARATWVMSHAAGEVENVAGHLGIPLPFDDAAEQAVAVARATYGNRSSMAQDIARDMPTEIEQICGAVSRYGRQIDQPTPVNDALLHLVRAQVRNGFWHEAIIGIPPDLQPVFADLAALEAE